MSRTLKISTLFGASIFVAMDVIGILVFIEEVTCSKRACSAANPTDGVPYGMLVVGIITCSLIASILLSLASQSVSVSKNVIVIRGLFWRKKSVRVDSVTSVRRTDFGLVFEQNGAFVTAVILPQESKKLGNHGIDSLDIADWLRTVDAGRD